jgi:hypothetical protein
VLFAVMTAWRQHEGWAFASGLSVNLAATLLVAHLQREADWGEWWVALVQMNILASAGTTLVWLAVRRRRYIDEAPDPFASPLLSIKIALELLANALLVAVPLALLVFEPGAVHPLVKEAGDVWSWLALGVSLWAACWYFGEIAGRFGVSVLCGLGLTLGVLAACTAGRLASPGDWLEYHVLTAGWSLTGIVLPVVAWRKNSGAIQRPGFPVHIVRRWTMAMAVLVSGLALRGVAVDPAGPWWSAAALASVSATGGLIAVWRRDARWAFGSGLVLNLAVSLILWRLYRGEPLADWWIPLVQLNVLACAGVALAWLVGRAWPRRAEVEVRALSLLLVAQVALGLIGNAAVLVAPAVRLIASPDSAPAALVQLEQAGAAWGWLALVAATAAAIGLLRQAPTRLAQHFVYGLGLGLGVLAACTAVARGSSGWGAYHVLMTAWAALAALVLAGGWRAGAGRGEASGWLAAVLLLVAGLAARSVGQDPSGLAWPGGGFLAVGLLAGCAAVWLRSEPWAVAGGAALNAAASLLVWHFNYERPLRSGFCHWRRST